MASGWKLTSIAKAVGATWDAPAPTRVQAIGTDSRRLPPAALFVALRGESFDGHTFVPKAIAGGARAVLVDRRGAARLGAVAVPMLVVEDTLRALGDLAAWARGALEKPVVAVTGSNGKTTTKELVAAVLGEKGTVHKTQGNLNNLIGVPLTLLEWPEAAWAAVVEMGMNAPGEIARLTDIAKPDVGIVTCVAAAHLGGVGLGSIPAIARAKAELYDRLPSQATAVLNGDDAPLVEAAQAVLGQRPVLRFGRSAGCDVRLCASMPTQTGVMCELEVAGTPLRINLPLIGQHNAMNAAAACAAGLALGLPVEPMATHLGRVKVPGARLRIVPVPRRQLTIIDDSYNANPGSMAAAFAAQRDVAGSARRLAVLGDMLELGEDAARLHRELGQAAADAGIAMLWGLGPLAPQTVQGARDGGVTAAHYQERELQVLCRDLLAQVRSGDVLLVKGSRGMRMERVVQWLQGDAG